MKVFVFLLLIPAVLGTGGMVGGYAYASLSEPETQRMAKVSLRELNKKENSVRKLVEIVSAKTQLKVYKDNSHDNNASATDLQAFMVFNFELGEDHINMININGKCVRCPYKPSYLTPQGRKQFVKIQSNPVERFQ